MSHNYSNLPLKFAQNFRKFYIQVFQKFNASSLMFTFQTYHEALVDP